MAHKELLFMSYFLSVMLFVLTWSGRAHALATNCTLYAAANGSDANNGATPSTPKTLNGASRVTVPGSVVCLKGGTYNMPATFYPYNNGAPNAWITYRDYGDSDVNLVWTGGSSGGDITMFHFIGNTLATGKSYIEVRGLHFNGQNLSADALFCYKSHHLRFIGNTIKNMGSAGIASKFCDYLTSDGNKLSHNGYLQGWASAISYNSNQWLDTAAGYHSFVVNNTMSGTFDGSSFHSDGNGIIMDQSNDSHDFSTANTPPVLIANNVVYENGGRCIETLTVTNIWVVHNTCYKNALDLNEPGIGEIVSYNTKDSYFINNIVYAWNNHNTYQQLSSNSNLKYYKNLGFGGSKNFSYSAECQFLTADPHFLSPPTVNATA